MDPIRGSGGDLVRWWLHAGDEIAHHRLASQDSTQRMHMERVRSWGKPREVGRQRERPASGMAHHLVYLLQRRLWAGMLAGLSRCLVVP